MFSGTSLGLILQPERLTWSFRKQATFGDPSRPSPVLLNIIYAWGIVLSGSPILISHQSVFLSRAVYHARNSGQSSSPYLVQQKIQAELLLVHWFFHMGFPAEGKEHSDAALRLSLSQGVHKIRGAEIPDFYAPIDASELGERMNAVWMSFLTDTCVSYLWVGYPTAFPDQEDEQGRIDMPWPLDMAQYEKVNTINSSSLRPRLNLEQGLTLPKILEGGTITSFINNPVVSYAYEEVSFIAMECMAAALLRQSTDFTTRWNPSKLRIARHRS